MLSTKDQASFFQELKGFIESGAAIPVEGEPASTPAKELSQIARDANISLVTAASVEQAIGLLHAKLSQQPCRLLIAGSLYMAGHVLKTHG